MKRAIFTLFILCSFFCTKALWFSTNVKILAYNNDSLVSEVISWFPFGSGGICKLYSGTTYIVQNDTLKCYVFYNTSGAHAAFFCMAIDTITPKPSPVGIHYATFIGNHYSTHPVSGISDTTWNVNDTTILLFPTNSINTDKNEDYFVCPNPSSGEIDILAGNPVGESSITILNSLGQIIIQGMLLNSNRTKIDLSHIMKGIYFIEIKTSGKIKRLRLLKN